MEEQEMKDCPFCGEQIMAKAIVCKHCKSSLIIPPTPVLLNCEDKGSAEQSIKDNNITVPTTPQVPESAEKKSTLGSTFAWVIGGLIVMGIFRWLFGPKLFVFLGLEQ